jgi:hypothetical protein
MPSKPFDPAKPTIYLDTSTLCDAVRVHVLGGRPVHAAYRPLMPWIDRAARDANVCLSLIHLNELARWPDIASADATATWLDGLPIVWVRSRMTVERTEDERWTRLAAGVPSPGPDPFAPSMGTAFDAIDGRAVSAILASKCPVLSLLKTARLMEKRYTEAPFEAANTFRADRAWAEQQGWSEEKKRERTEQNVRTALRTRALEADRRLVARLDASYLGKTCTSGDVQDLLVDLYDGDLQALPLFRIDRLFIEGFVAAALRKQAGSAKERDALGGSFYDNLHLIGAAYCDVFTCDRETSNWLGSFRTQIGRAPQLTVGGHARGVEGFVADLMSTWP